MAKVLVVDDDEMNRDMLSRRLKRKGFDVSIAVNGKEAVDITREEKPDIVLMDLSMPVMDGYEATGILKGDDATKAIPIVGLSAHAMVGDREKAINAGCDEYDTKPVDLPRLLGLIEKFIGTQA
jgi:CheY-like chemotaxis protein